MQKQRARVPSTRACMPRQGDDRGSSGASTSLQCLSSRAHWLRRAGTAAGRRDSQLSTPAFTSWSALGQYCTTRTSGVCLCVWRVEHGERGKAPRGSRRAGSVCRSIREVSTGLRIAAA
eukprot:189100-Rhodomonas_salina.1